MKTLAGALFITAIGVSVSSNAMAGSLKKDLAACGESLNTAMTSIDPDARVRFHRSRGAGKSTLTYNVIMADQKYTATCIAKRGKALETHYSPELDAMVAELRAQQGQRDLADAETN